MVSSELVGDSLVNKIVVAESAEGKDDPSTVEKSCKTDICDTHNLSRQSRSAVQ